MKSHNILVYKNWLLFRADILQNVARVAYRASKKVSALVFLMLDKFNFQLSHAAPVFALICHFNLQMNYQGIVA